MNPLSNLSREQKIYLALWRKAYRTGETIEVKLASYSQALSMRMAMYRTIKPYRDDVMLDEELKSAADAFVLSVLKDSKTLTLQPRGTLSAAEQAMADLGITEEDLLSPEELKIQAALSQELDHLTGPADAQIANMGKPDNPFYKRDER